MKLLIDMLLRRMACGKRRLSGTCSSLGSDTTLSVVNRCRLAGMLASRFLGKVCKEL